MSELNFDCGTYNLTISDVKNRIVKIRISDGDLWPYVEINKDQAQQIITHLQQQFNL